MRAVGWVRVRLTGVVSGRRLNEMAACMRLRRVTRGEGGMEMDVRVADIQALRQAVGCGVVLLATAHGESRRDLERRPLYRELLEQRLFERLVTIRRTGTARHYAVEEME